jgi:sec-independent protein translocase protein TatC
VISQLSLALPLMLLYEGSIWSVTYVQKKAAREAAEAAAKAAGASTSPAE